MLLVLLLPPSRFSRVRLCDPGDGSPPGSPVPGILQDINNRHVICVTPLIRRIEIKGTEGPGSENEEAS